MDSWWQDVRHAVRSFTGTGRLTLAALACIALGIGATVLIVTLARAILLQAAPFAGAERLVRIWTVQEGTGNQDDVSYPEVRDLQAQARSFEAVEVTARTRAAVMTADGTERLRGESVTSGYFGMIAVQPALGRLFSAAEYEPGADRVMLIGDALWRRKFGGRADVIGQTVRVRGGMGEDQVFTIVGVLPPGFAGTVDPDVSEFWIPIAQHTSPMLRDSRTSRASWVLARLRPGVTLAAAQSEVAAIGQRLAQQYPEAYQRIGLGVEPFGESWRARYRSGLLMLIGAAGLLLLIACTNVAHLLLARMAQREHELVLRAVLGAPRGRILRQLMVESLVLATTGGLAGTLLAALAVRVFVAAGIFQLPAYVHIGIDGWAVALAVALTLLAAATFGALPLWLGGRVNAAQSLREAGRSVSAGRRQRRISDALVTAEVTFSFVLLIAAALMLRTYGNLTKSDVGFRTDNLVRLALSLDAQRYPDGPAQLAFAREAKAALAHQPGVAGVSFIAGVLPPWYDPDVPLAVGGVPQPALSAVQRHAVDDSFFEVMEIPVQQGRAFTEADRAGSQRVAIVSASLARALTNGDARAAIGRTLQVVRNPATGLLGEPIEIVGIARDVRYHGPLNARTAEYDLYIPIEHAPDDVLSIAIATTRDADALVEPLQRVLGSLAPTSPQHWISTMKGELRLQFGDARVYAWLTGVFGTTALLLAMLGLYGVVSNAAARRFREVGIRMAIGARRADILRLVLGEAARPLAVGVAVGAVLALLLARLVGTLVYGMAPTDLPTFAAVASALLVVGLAACYFPASRATRIEPGSVLRS